MADEMKQVVSKNPISQKNSTPLPISYDDIGEYANTILSKYDISFKDTIIIGLIHKAIKNANGTPITFNAIIDQYHIKDDVYEAVGRVKKKTGISFFDQHPGNRNVTTNEEYTGFLDALDNLVSNILPEIHNTLYSRRKVIYIGCSETIYRRIVSNAISVFVSECNDKNIDLSVKVYCDLPEKMHPEYIKGRYDMMITWKDNKHDKEIGNSYFDINYDLAIVHKKGINANFEDHSHLEIDESHTFIKLENRKSLMPDYTFLPISHRNIHYVRKFEDAIQVAMYGGITLALPDMLSRHERCSLEIKPFPNSTPLDRKQMSVALHYNRSRTKYDEKQQESINKLADMIIAALHRTSEMYNNIVKSRLYVFNSTLHKNGVEWHVAITDYVMWPDKHITGEYVHYQNPPNVNNGVYYDIEGGLKKIDKKRSQIVIKGAMQDKSIATARLNEEFVANYVINRGDDINKDGTVMIGSWVGNSTYYNIDKEAMPGTGIIVLVPKSRYSEDSSGMAGILSQFSSDKELFEKISKYIDRMNKCNDIVLTESNAGKNVLKNHRNATKRKK